MTTETQAPDPAPDMDGGDLPCPRCNGSGFELQWSDASPDAHQIEVNCDHCDGAGSLGAAYTHLSQMLKSERERSKKHTDELHWLKSGPFFGLRADKSIQTVADRLDELADACGKYDPRSERASDIRAAATAWRKHLAGPAIPAPEGAQLPEPHGMKWLNKKTGATGVYFEDPRQFGINTEHPDYEWTPIYTADQLRAALAAPAPQAPIATVEDNSQDWAGMDGTTAWHLIERHADNWNDIGKMMGEWLAANQAAPSPAEGDGIPEGDPWDEHQLDGIFDAIRNNCGPATASRVRAILRAFQAGAQPQPKGMPAEWLDAFEEWRQTLGAADLDGKRDLVWRHIAGTGFQAGAAWARSQAPAVQAWQLIETAPKNGRKLLLSYVNRCGKTRTVLACWLTDEEAAETDADGVGLEGGWYECIDNWEDYTEVAIHQGEPTHWMPLPAAPQTKEPTNDR